MATPTLSNHPAAPWLAPEGTRRRLWVTRLTSPLAAYYLILGSTIALTTLGLVMVLSSSNIDALVASGDSFAVFSKQAMFAALAIPAAWVASRMSPAMFAKLAWPVLGVVILLLLATAAFGVGEETTGNSNWLVLGPITIQPSEFAKPALIIWAAAVLTRKQPLLNQLPHLLVPVVPGALLVILLVLAGKDLGTAMVMMAMVGGVLWVVGAPKRLFAIGFLLASVIVVAMVASSANKMRRIDIWLGRAECDYYSSCWQPVHGAWALATGGWWGVGLGSGREKWGWLSAAHNDYIFAIIGEELGLVGTLAVLVLFAMLALGLYRLVVTADDLFVKVVAGGMLVWIIGQAIMNIATVIGALPVMGVPLPLVSAGGSALITTVVGLGIVIGFARRVPGADKALAKRPRRSGRTAAVLRRGTSVRSRATRATKTSATKIGATKIGATKTGATKTGAIRPAKAEVPRGATSTTRTLTPQRAKPSTSSAASRSASTRATSPRSRSTRAGGPGTARPTSAKVR